MKRTSLVDVLVESILDRIVRGVFTAHNLLPAESVLADEAGVSRLTAREAIKSLQAQKIVYVRLGRGIFVNPASEWSSLDAVLRAAAYDLGSTEVPLRLLEVRRMVETGAAELAAVNHTEDHLKRLDSTIVEMETAYQSGDLDLFTTQDLAFHSIVLTATGNPFLPALMGQLGHLLQTMRRETSAITEVQKHAIEHHQAVRAAIATRDPIKARQAMEIHIEQTVADYEQYIRSGR